MEGLMTKEQRRLDEARMKEKAWKKWGPYLSERQFVFIEHPCEDAAQFLLVYGGEQVSARHTLRKQCV
jgi:hypothetical protein